MRKGWGCIAAFTTLVALGAPGLSAAQSTAPQTDRYTWLGELVSVDETAKTMTVKSRVAYADAVSELKQFKPGERVWIVWSGIHDSTDAVRQIRRARPADADAHMVLPAELVTPEAQHQLITFRVKVPEGSVGALKALKAGDWIRVTARHRASSDAEAIVAVAPYVSTTTTN